MIEKNIAGCKAKNACVHSGLTILKLAVSEEVIVGINWFLYDGTSSGKLKIYLIIFGWRWSKMGEIDEINWFVACWYKFSKAKSCFNNYWMNMVKNGRGLKK